MGGIDIILIGIIAAAVGLALRSIHRQRKSGSGCLSCGGNCASCAGCASCAAGKKPTKAS